MINKKNIIFLGLFVFFVVVLCLFFFKKTKKEFLEVSFFDVGQGDAVFIELATGQNILIDGGPDDKIIESLSSELSFFDRKIDLLILTHPHDDHLNGLLSVLKKFEVETVLYTGVDYESLMYDDWKNSIKKFSSKQKIIENNQKIKISEKVYLDILYPQKSFVNQKINNLNNSSIVVKFVYGKNSFLFTGDIEKEVENELCSLNIDLEAKILKVAHHGSDTSSQMNFLEAIDPLFAVIPVGLENKFGFPQQRVLNRLKKKNIFIFRNDLDGNVKFYCDMNYCVLSPDML